MPIQRKHATMCLGVLMIATLSWTTSGAAQVGRRTPREANDAAGASLSVTATVGGTKFSATGAGRCDRETGASLYDKPAILHLVEYSGPGELRGLRLTLWQFKDGSPIQLGLTLEVEKGSHQISTLQGGHREGDATATVQLVGTGGRIVVLGRDGKRVQIQATIECTAFGGIEAEGG